MIITVQVVTSLRIEDILVAVISGGLGLIGTLVTMNQQRSTSTIQTFPEMANKITELQDDIADKDKRLNDNDLRIKQMAEEISELKKVVDKLTQELGEKKKNE